MVKGPAAQTVPVTTLGEALVDRPQNDTFSGNVFVASDPPFGVRGRVVAWRFFDNDSPGALVTPLLLELTGPSEYTVRGIGTTRPSDGSGVQEFAFDAVGGSSDVVLPNYYLGWKDGSPDRDPENAGVIDSFFSGNNEPLTFMEWGAMGGGPAIIQDGIIDNVAGNFRAIGGRDYSVQFDVLLASADGGTFVDRQILASTAQGSAITTGDIDGDGDDDVVVGTRFGELFWLENVGGNFDPTRNAIDPGSIETYNSVSTADLDNDGDLDVIAGSQVFQTILWWVNDGTGSFFSVPVSPRDTEVARLGDLGNDGDLDVVFISSSGNDLGVVENIGTATTPDFGGDTVIDTSQSLSFASAELGHVTPDGALDVLVAGEDDGFSFIRWYTDTGSGLFPPTGLDLAPGIPLTVSIPVDLDGDGDLDTATGTGSGTIMLTSDFPGLSPALSHVTAPGNVSALDSADVDLDGDIDLFGITDTQVFWLENLDGQGHFGPSRIMGSLGVNLQDLVHADIDGDGDQDILTVSDGKVSLYRNRTVGRTLLYPSESEIFFTPGTEPFANRPALMGDLDRDGDPDIVVGNAEATIGNEVYLNDGGSFTRALITADVGDTESILLLDANGDGALDLVTGEGGDNRLYLNDGVGAPFDTLPGGTSLGNPGGLTYDLRAGDIDLDGDIDFVAGNAAPSSNYWYENLGGGLFAIPSIIGSADADPTFGVALGDLDGDGDLDLVAANFSVDDKVYMNDGVGDPWDSLVTGSALPDPGNSGSVHVELGDVDSDGDLDALVLNGGIVLYRNPGNTPVDTNPFVAAIPEQIVARFGMRTIRLADADLDGDLDIFSANSGNDLLFLNDGSGWTTPPLGQILGTFSDSTQDVALADFDRDGDLDAVTVADNGRLSLLANRGGQYHFDVTDVVPAAIREGQKVPLFKVALTSRARPGDSSVELARLDVNFTVGGSPMSSSLAQNIFQALHVYRDTGSGKFEEGSDIRVATATGLILTADGTETIILPDNDPNLRVALPASFFVVVELTDDAADSWLSNTGATRPEGTLRDVEDGNSDIAVKAEPTFQVPVLLPTPLQSVPVDLEGDVISVGDGVTSLREAIIAANSIPGSAVILIPPGTYTLSIAGTGENAAATGDLDITDTVGELLIIGSGADVTIIDADGIDRVFELLPGASARFEGLTIKGGDPDGSFGGGLLAGAGSSLGIVDSIVTENAAQFGAALFADSSVLVEGTTISSNSGSFILGPAATMTISNSTISDNTGDSAVLSSAATSDVAISNSTLSGNSGHAVTVASGGVASLTSSIVAGNSFAIGAGEPDLFGPVSSGGFNLVGKAVPANGLTDGVNNDQIGSSGAPIDPLVGPLQDNGGTTLTQVPLEGSPAIDTGNCGGLAVDQRGFDRPSDIPDVPLVPVSDECDIGATEATFVEASSVTLAEVEIPIRWCAVRGAPSVPLTPGPGDDAVDALLLDRLQRVNEQIFGLSAKIRFRSGATAVLTDFPLLDDPDVTVGAPGDVMIDPTTLNFDEFQQLIATCRSEWEALEPDVTGITAVSMGRFVDPNGTPLQVLGLGGRAAFGQAAQQVVTGRVMVVDPLITLAGNPPDLADAVLGHELGHALALPHGNGLDDDGNGLVDDNDERLATPDPLPRFDGPNLMQYRKGKQLSINQIALARFHALGTINDVGITAFQALSTDDGAIDEDLANILEFGLATVAQADLANILEFDLANILEFDLANILEFDLANILEFDFANIVDFGISQDELNDVSTLFTSTGGLLWPTPVRPDADFYFYVNVDPLASPATGAVPGASGFPGAGVAVEGDIDLILKVNVSATCSGGPTTCTEDNNLTIFQWDGASFQEVTASNTVTTPAQVEQVAVGLIVDNGGAPLEIDEQRIAVNVQAVIDNSVLRTAGWTDGDEIRLEAVSEVDCTTPLPNGSTIDCQCTDCMDCPDYPGCEGAPGDIPATVPPELVLDCASGPLSVIQPVLPECLVTPAVVSRGGTVTVDVTSFPTGAGNVEISLQGTVLASSALQPGGSASIPVVIPASATPGDRVLRALIPVRGTEDYCAVKILGTDPCAAETVAPTLAGVPAPVTVEQTSLAGTPVALALPTASDNCDASPVVMSDAPVSGEYPLGDTVVTFTATDALGNSSQATVTVTVEDTTDPDLTLPAPPTVEAVSPAGTSVPFTPSATDICDAAPVVADDAPPLFGLGVTTVNVTATDASGNQAQGSFDVTVVDTTGPQIAGVPAPIVAEQTSPAGASVTVPLPTATDNSDPAPSVGSDAPAVFPPGVTVVTFTATDALGNSSQATTTVTVQDTIPPTLDVSVSPEELWPPNHKMKSIDVTLSADDVSGAPLVRLETLTSNEPDNGSGDGNTDDDIQINVAGTVLSRNPMQVQVGLPYVPSMEIELRAERQGGGNGRLYTLTFSATDNAGNVTTKIASVLVPHDRGGVVEPVTINLAPGSNGSVVSWNGIEDAQHYNVIRTRLSQMNTSGPAINLGSVDCLAGASTATSLEDADMPPPAVTCAPGESMCLNEAFMYFVEYHDGRDSGYGTERVPKPRLAATGDCP